MRHFMSMTGTALVAVFCVSTMAQAQYHYDTHNHAIKDNFGRIIGQYQHNVLHQDSHHVVPHNQDYHGTYYQRNNGYYYVPETYNSGHSGHNHGGQAPSPEQMTFGGFGHVDDLAARLETLCNDFCLDLHYNYQHNYGFRETYAEAYQILEVARYIHDAEHHQDRDAIRAKIGGMDELFHHVEDDVRGWSRQHYRQVGQLGIITKMEIIESTLHHLMYDIGAQMANGNGQAPAPNGGGGNFDQAPPPR